MIRRCLPWLAVAFVLGITLALMWGPMRDETATNDETVFLGAGYSYWQGHRYYLNVEHPPLMQLWSALPLQLIHVNPPAQPEGYFDESLFPHAVDWNYDLQPHPALAGSRERDTAIAPAREGYYHYPALESVMFGSQLVYGGQNDADKLLFWGRFMQAVVTLATGLLVFLWARSLSNVTGGLLALAAWCFNPLA